tara:strand:- start:2369 stop:3013 length:645 start_codon:yes stop_codon:yes gene_type:complete
MIKHVGRQGDKKVVVVFREVPGEDHMALVVYPDQLQQNLHDDLMNAIQSAKGQAAKDLGDAIHGITGTNGRTILNTLHSERFMKKIRTQDILMIPQPNNPGVRLDELNKIIRDLDTGSDAAGKLAELDANAGIADPKKKAAGVKAAATAMGNPGVLSDESIAQNLVQQADQMKAQMANLEAEASRLMEEAQGLNPALKPKAKRGRKPAAKKAIA